MPWQPILEGARAARAQEAIAQLTTRGSRRWKRRKSAGLALGYPGIALMHAYLSRARDDAARLRRARKLLDRSVLAMTRLQMSGSLTTGLTGIAWVIAHLDREGILPADEELAAVLDRALLDAVRVKVWRDDVDLHQGLVGIGTVALERMPRKDAWRTLEQVVGHLGATAERVGPGLAWSSVDPDTGQRMFLLGLTHGIAGIIAFLARMVELGISPARSRRLLDGAMETLLAHRLPRGATSRFPCELVPGQPLKPFRSAWCHGDIGISTQLLLAARRTGTPAWERLAVRVARDCATRSFEDAWNWEPILCHGSLGTAHLLNRMFQATGDPALRRGAIRHIDHALRLWRAAESGKRPYRDYGERGLLVGDAGMALALLAATTAVEPNWDRWMSVAMTPLNT
ncbi:MAG TPA: lanthionine synthetase LanC family protein [Myxococcales bacterium]|nr:lanthionine synthetase LanC family protein [Myxococcales bacterium]